MRKGKSYKNRKKILLSKLFNFQEKGFVSNFPTKLFIVKKLNVNPEKYIKNHLKNLGFVVFKPNKSNFCFLTRKHKILKEMISNLFLHNRKNINKFFHDFHRKGRPDFLAYNDEVFFFVEVKLNSDGLRVEQTYCLYKLQKIYRIPVFIFRVLELKRL